MAGRGKDAKTRPSKQRTFGPDRKGESSAGALATKVKKRAVAASRGTSNTR
jgi:hypothetical protein